MRPVEEQLSRLADQAMAAHTVAGTAQAARHRARPVLLWAGGLLAVTAVVTLVVVIGRGDGPSTLVPAPDTTAVADTTAGTDVAVTTPSTSVTIDTTVPGTADEPSTASTDVPAPALLRPGGVGDFDFGSPMDDVVAALDSTGVLGASAMSDHGPSNDPVLGCSVHYTVAWPQAGLTLGFADPVVEPCTGQPVLVGWQLRPPGDAAPPVDVRVAGGLRLGLGSTYPEFAASWPGFAMYPDGGGIGAGDPRFGVAHVDGVRMTVQFADWDWVRAVQAGLVADGASIEIDGQLGPATAAAFQGFAAAHGGASDGELFELLGAVPPSSVLATWVVAGDQWFWEQAEPVCDGPEWTLHGDVCG